MHIPFYAAAKALLHATVFCAGVAGIPLLVYGVYALTPWLLAPALVWATVAGVVLFIFLLMELNLDECTGSPTLWEVASTNGVNAIRTSYLWPRILWAAPAPPAAYHGLPLTPLPET